MKIQQIGSCLALSTDWKLKLTHLLMTHHNGSNITVINVGLIAGYQGNAHPPEIIPAGRVLSFHLKAPFLLAQCRERASPMQHLQQEYYMYEVIVVWSCELLQQLSNVMIAGESSAPPPAADWTAHSRPGTINQEISL